MGCLDQRLVMMILKYFSLKRVVAILAVFAILASAFPYQAEAAPAYITSGSFDITLPTGSGNTDNAFDSGSTGSDRILIVVVSWRNSAGHIVNDNAVAYGGASTTPFGAQVESGQATQKMFYLLNPATGSNTLRLFTSDGVGTNANAMISAYVYSDVDQTTPYDGYTTSTGTDDSAELTVTSAVGDTPFYAFTWRGAGGSSIAETNYTQRVENFAGGSSMGTGGGEGTGAASVAFVGQVGGEFASNGWSALGVNLNAAAGGGGGDPVVIRQDVFWFE